MPFFFFLCKETWSNVGIQIHQIYTASFESSVPDPVVALPFKETLCHSEYSVR